MPSLKISVKDFYPGDKDEFGLREDEYFTPDSIRLVEDMLGIFGFMGLRPVAYQIGHRFYNVERKQTFIAMTEETLQAAKFHMGTRIIWLPTIDEIIRQISYDGIRLTLLHSGQSPEYVYRTYIYDPLFPGEQGYYPFKNTSYDPWVSIVFPVARAYLRRFDTFGIDTFTRTIYTTDKDFSDNPLPLVDQTAEIKTKYVGLRRNDRSSNTMEGKTRRKT